jgi:hypothetical protein
MHVEPSGGTSEQSMMARNRVGTGLSYTGPPGELRPAESIPGLLNSFKMSPLAIQQRPSAQTSPPMAISSMDMNWELDVLITRVELMIDPPCLQDERGSPPLLYNCDSWNNLTDCVDTRQTTHIFRPHIRI